MNGAGENRIKRVSGDHRADAVGAACSLACGVHCLAIPLMLAVSPTTRLLDWFTNPIVHQVAAVTSALVVAWALWPNWSRYRDKTVATTAIAGLTLLSIAAFVLPDFCCAPQDRFSDSKLWTAILPLQAFVAPVGGSMILLAHLFNMQLTRRTCKNSLR